MATAKLLQGKQLSYNNINDTDAAFELVSEFDPSVAACAIIKHANPCGVAAGDSLVDAYRRALECDQTSAFGGIIALNRSLDAATATEIVKIFTEVIIAPDASDEARDILSSKKNLAADDHRRSCRSAPARYHGENGCRRAAGPGPRQRNRAASGFQGGDQAGAGFARELADLAFAFRVAKHVKSNAIVYVQNGATVGDRRRPDEPGRFGPDRSTQGGGRCRGARA